MPPAWAENPRQYCISCHPVHYRERGNCVDCHHGNPASERKNIAHAGLRAGKYVRFTLGDTVRNGVNERLLEQFACRRCHVSAGRGNRLAVSLDAAVSRKSTAELVHSLRQPATNMPDFKLDEEQITTLLNAIYSGSQGRTTDVTAPVKIHFTTFTKKNNDTFTTKCGHCHRILSERLGSVGAVDIGPNLSGLLTVYYPKTFKNSVAWTVQNLADWLKNPRAIRPWANMQPLVLTATEMNEITTIIFVTP